MISLHLCCLHINGEKAPNHPPLSPPVPFLSYCPPPSGPCLPSPPSNSPPFSLLPHSYAFVSLPKTPPVKSLLLPTPPPPPPCFKFQAIYYCMASYQNFNIFGGPNWILLHACIHRVKQTIVHVILSKSVHQNTYRDVIRHFVKKPPCKGHL